jgi:hypothetical protein
MGTVEYAHWKNLERIKNLEQNRLNMLLGIIRKILKDKPERILGACYHSYLLDGKLQKVKGEKMKYLAILMVLFALVSCSGAKQQTGYSDNKCFNLCTAGQTCLIDQQDKRFHCSDKGVECSPSCSSADECKNVAGIPTCVPKPALTTTPGPTPTSGPTPNPK